MIFATRKPTSFILKRGNELVSRYCHQIDSGGCTHL